MYEINYSLLHSVLLSLNKEGEDNIKLITALSLLLYYIVVENAFLWLQLKSVVEQTVENKPSNCQCYCKFCYKRLLILDMIITDCGIYFFIFRKCLKSDKQRYKTSL